MSSPLHRRPDGHILFPSYQKSVLNLVESHHRCHPFIHSSSPSAILSTSHVEVNDESNPDGAVNTNQPITHHVTISELATSLIDSCAALISLTPPSLRRHAGCDQNPPESSLILRATSLHVCWRIFCTSLSTQRERLPSVVAGCLERWLLPLRSPRVPIRPLERPPRLLKRSTNASIAIELLVGANIAAGMKDRVSLINFWQRQVATWGRAHQPRDYLEEFHPYANPIEYAY